MSGFDNDVMYAKNADFTQADNQSVSEANGLATNGQMWIGTTAVNAGGTHINVGSLTSPDGSLTFGYSSPNITVQVNGGTTVGKTITGNTGGALPPSGGNWNIITSNSTPKFAGSGSTETLDFALNNLTLGTSLPLLTSGNLNVGLGRDALAALTSGTVNVAVGYHAALALTTGSGNTAVGENALLNVTTGAGNTAVGTSALSTAITLASNNTAIGNNCLSGVGTGVYNIGLGTSAGLNYVNTDTSNIAIGNAGVGAESNTIRIGTQASASYTHSACYIAGIVGVTTSNSQLVTINSSTGQLGVVSASGFTWTDVTGATQTIAVANGYITDRGGGVTYTLPATAALGDTFKIVGKLGLATITPNANQQILIGSSSGSVGVTGTAVSTNVGDCIELICITSGASTVWRAQSVIGTWTLS